MRSAITAEAAIFPGSQSGFNLSIAATNRMLYDIDRCLYNNYEKNMSTALSLANKSCNEELERYAWKTIAPLYSDYERLRSIASSDKVHSSLTVSLSDSDFRLLEKFTKLKDQSIL